MDILPAIDLRSGKCVRLIQGQYHRQITYGDDPAAQAEQFQADGAKWLHIVDLDGARLGRPSNTAESRRLKVLSRRPRHGPHAILSVWTMPFSTLSLLASFFAARGLGLLGFLASALQQSSETTESQHHQRRRLGKHFQLD